MYLLHYVIKYHLGKVGYLINMITNIYIYLLYIYIYIINIIMYTLLSLQHRRRMHLRNPGIEVQI